jgi:small neutral amino acid transporter SnatA (MarC family)
MGKFLSVIIGTAVAVLGLVGLFAWIGDFLVVLKGSVPIFLIFGGAIAVIAGVSEIKDELAAKKEEKKEEEKK